ncbi:hypothetical protein RYX36_010249 [Vicia faba]
MRSHGWLNFLMLLVSLAAKDEETQVPLLLDLQVKESRYLFEEKTVKKMEILVLSALGCEDVVLSVIRSDSNFMSYLPSALATAAMIHVFNNVEPSLGDEYKNQLLNILGINKEKVDECGTLMMKLWSEYGEDNENKLNKRKFDSILSSPNGVMDVSFSCENSNDSWVVAATVTVSSSPEPLSKRIKIKKSFY